MLLTRGQSDNLLAKENTTKEKMKLSYTPTIEDSVFPKVSLSNGLFHQVNSNSFTLD